MNVGTFTMTFDNETEQALIIKAFEYLTDMEYWTRTERTGKSTEI